MPCFQTSDCAEPASASSIPRWNWDFGKSSGHYMHDQPSRSPTTTVLGETFDDVVLPHLDVAYRLARWLMRNEQDAQDVVQEASLRAFKSFSGFHGSNGRAWLLTIVRNTAYTLLKKKGVADLTTPFDEQIHASDGESVSAATILERSE